MLQTRILPAADNAYAYPLLIKRLLLSGARYEKTREIVYRDQLRYSYATFNERVARRATVQKRYLTYKLDLIKTLATKAVDAYYVEASGMRVRELRLLRLVHDTPGVAATELRHRLVLDKTLLSKNLADLEKRGLIERETDPHDNRVQRLHLSAVGLRVWRECERIGRRLEAEMFADMPEDDWHRLHDLLDSALASLDRWRAEHGGRGT